ncbi:MAG TPA: hypothetical protein VK929_05650 [Longimicrobiales bacterium]|nr:hypothetical protein [Longimicrobiales bacterium]
MKVRPFRRLASTLVVVAALAPTACDFGTEPLFAIFWSGTFSADPSAPFIIGGTTEMVANPGDTSAGIFLDAAVTEPVTMGWHIRYGACGETGDRVAGMDAFPPVTITETGSGTALASIRRRLPAGSYAAEVFTAHDATGDRLACADLIQES